MNNQLNKNMNNLKDLNLISVLNNMDDERLKNIFKKVDCVKLTSLMKYIICHKCDKTIYEHYKCSNCFDTSCYSFYNFKDSVCIRCIKDIAEYAGFKLSTYYSTLQIETCEYDYYLEIYNAKIKQHWIDKVYTCISCEELLKILKDNNIKY